MFVHVHVMRSKFSVLVVIIIVILECVIQAIQAVRVRVIKNEAN